MFTRTSQTLFAILNFALIVYRVDVSNDTINQFKASLIQY